MKDIDEILRNNRPVVKDNPTFLLETNHRLEAVEGIKAEVDRQRSYGRTALIVALIAGLAVGVLATALAFLFPVDTQSVEEGLWQSIRLFLESWKQYLIYPVAVLAVALSLVVSAGNRTSLGNR